MTATEIPTAPASKSLAELCETDAEEFREVQERLFRVVNLCTLIHSIAARDEEISSAEQEGIQEAARLILESAKEGLKDWQQWEQLRWKLRDMRGEPR